jgi:hypothetical protein
MAYVTQEHLRKLLMKELQGRTQVSLCRELGIKPQNLSIMVKGSPIIGRLLAHLGYEKVDDLYRKIP